MQASRSIDQPLLGEINTTPLIDVMLVLLIMLIITIPMQTHAVKIDLPSCPTCPQVKAVSNEVAIDRSGVVMWNGELVTMDGLRHNLRLSQEMRPLPELHVRPQADARYGRVDEVLAAIKREHVRRFGFVGNEAYREL